MAELITPDGKLKSTAVFDTYWKFAAARQEIFLKRVAGANPPWTNDDILSKHRFTNVFRASDRVSQFLIRDVAYKGLQTPEEILFRLLLFKFFNKIETWQCLERSLKEISWSSFDFRLYDDLLEQSRGRGESIYSAAYIMASPNLGKSRKHSNHLLLIDQMMKDQLPQKIVDAPSLQYIYELLLGYPSIGRFLAYQLTIDINYTSLVEFSEMDFVVAGPGARDGIRKCFPDIRNLSEEDIIRAVTETADSHFDRLGLSFPGLWGRKLQLIDCQNLFCEVDKYARVAHPGIDGISGRTRIKQKYRLTARPLPQWYPPSWGIHPPKKNAVDNVESVESLSEQELLFA